MSSLVLNDETRENQVKDNKQNHEQHAGFGRSADQAFYTMDQNSHHFEPPAI
jgi:hypothetical protein